MGKGQGKDGPGKSKSWFSLVSENARDSQELGPGTARARYGQGQVRQGPGTDKRKYGQGQVLPGPGKDSALIARSQARARAMQESGQG